MPIIRASEKHFMNIQAGNLFLSMKTGRCQGMVVLNDSKSDEYREIDWKTGEGQVLIVHRLAGCDRDQSTR